MSVDKRNKADLHYPCLWVYKIIGTDQEAMKSAVSEIIQDRACTVNLSRSSENARYHCLNVEVMVESESHRQIIYESLKSHRAVKIVL